MIKIKDKYDLKGMWASQEYKKLLGEKDYNKLLVEVNNHRKTKDIKRKMPSNSMAKFRKVKRYSNVNVITLKPIDMEDLNLKTDDEVDISKIKKKVAKDERV